MARSFPLGQIVATPGALEDFTEEECKEALTRHSRGDWGQVRPEDEGLNDRALDDGDRLLSVYEFPLHGKLWVITEWDRSVTTILRPEDY